MQPAPDRRNPIRLKRLHVESTEKKKRSTPELINRFTEVILDMREKEFFTEGAYARIMSIAKRGFPSLRHVSAEWQLGDKEFMLPAAKQDGGVLFVASERLRGDREVVLTAVQMKG